MGSQFRKRRLGKLHDQPCFLRLLQRGAETDFSLRSLDLNPIDRLVVLLIKLPLFERGDACAGKGFLRHTAQHLVAQGQPPAAHGHPVPSKHVVQARVKQAQPHRPEDPKKRDQKPLQHVALAFPAGEERKEEGAAGEGGDRKPYQGEKHQKTALAARRDLPYLAAGSIPGNTDPGARRRLPCLALRRPRYGGGHTFR